MKIRLIATDCDGVLTDGHAWLSENTNQIFKRFSFQDIMGLNLAQKRGVRIAIISGEPISKSLVKKLDIRKLYPNVKYAPIIREKIKDKAAVFKNILKSCSVEAKNSIYVGDDVNDIEAIKIAGIGITVKNAHPLVKKSAKIVTKKTGGSGAIREIVDRFI